MPVRWTTGKPLGVDIAVAGADRWRGIVASGEGPLMILPGSGNRPGATLHVAAGRLPAVLAATATDPADASIEGDPVPVGTLLGWLDRAQRARSVRAPTGIAAVCGQAARGAPRASGPAPILDCAREHPSAVHLHVHSEYSLLDGAATSRASPPARPRSASRRSASPTTA